MPTIGDKLPVSLPTFQVGQPEAETWRLQDALNRILKAYVEDQTIVDLINALTTRVDALSATLSAALSVQIVDSAGTSAVVDVGGKPMLRVWDGQAHSALLDLKVELLDKLEDLRRNAAAIAHASLRPGKQAIPRGIPAATTSQVLVSADGLRTAVSIQNVSSSNLYLAIGSVVAGNTLGTYGVKMTPGQYFEPPPPGTLSVISGVWDAGFLAGEGAAIQEYRR